MKIKIVAVFLILGLQLVSQEMECERCCPTTELSIPRYCGGFHVDGSWIYLRPTATDADLEYGSFITLTTGPANLNALLLEVEPSHRSGYDLGLGYTFRNSNQSIHASFFSLHANGDDNKQTTSLNELIQNFLGASYSTSKAQSKHRIDQAALFYRFDSVIDRVLNMNLALGITYANIQRDFDVDFQDLVLNPTPSQLTGKEESRYWGVGPFIQMEFVFPLLHRFGVEGKLEAGVLFGEKNSKVSSDSFRNNTASSFFSKTSAHPIVTNLNCDLALVYSHPFTCDLGLEVKLGYQIHYYFKPINRINPFNGYVNNPNTFPVDQTSNLGLGGPYVLVSLNQSLFPRCCDLKSCYSLVDRCIAKGPFFEFTSYWLEPRPTNDDLVFATLSEPSGGQKDLQADPGLNWAGQYQLGYRFTPTIDLCFTAFFFSSSDKEVKSANSGETISSVNASGPSNVVFSRAKSRVQYDMNQYDGILGKSMQLYQWINLHTGVGLRYLKQDRILTNEYLGGTPPLTTQSKFPKLKSEYHGIGPLFSLEPSFGPFFNFEVGGRLALAFLVGESKATLDQDNFGLVGFSSNDLRTPETPFIAPVFEGSGGLSWNCNFSRANISIEGGYQYMAYYRTVRLLLPTLLTGLEQINSNLILQGPYVRGQICFNF